MKSRVLFIQNRPHRAGAQTCLARLLEDSAIRSFNPLVLCSQQGWLTEECDQLNIPYIIEPFPSSRSLRARFYGNKAFAARVKQRIDSVGFQLQMVFANDHWEGLLGLAIGKLTSSKKIILLRSPGMTEDHYGKYGCHQYDCVATIGDELHRRVQEWAPDHHIEKVYDGIRSCEFLSPKPRATERPSRVLVIGSALDWRGWADLTEAARILQKETECNWESDFTGDEPDRNKNDVHLDRLHPGTCSFLGRQEAFVELVRRYDLVINPSRQETFGMAAVEVLAAGVPLLSTKTGVMGHVQSDSSMLVPPAQPRDMAEAIGYIWKNWETVNFNVSDCQSQIRKRFMTDSMANRWVEIFHKYGMQCAKGTDL